MDYTPCQATDGFPSLRLEQAILDGNGIAVGFGDKQGMGWILARLGQTPSGPVRLCQPGTSVFSVMCCCYADAVPCGIEQVAEKQFCGFAGFGRKQIIEPQ